MNKGICFLTFVLGAAIGSVVTWKLVKDKYARQTQEDVDSVKESFRCESAEYHDELTAAVNSIIDHEETSEELVQKSAEARKEFAKSAKEKPSIINYGKMFNKVNFQSPEDTGDMDPEDYDKYSEYDKPTEEGPFIIPPDEFGEYEEFQRINLTYYEGDGILADENYEVVDDVDGTVGLKSLTTFGTYEDDSVHVKNNRLECYYEILKDESCYRKVRSDMPHPTGVDE